MRAINKKSKIVLGCLAFLLSLSVGYAYFSKEATIAGTVTGKGSFDISLTCTKSISSEFVSSGYVSSSEISELQFGYSTDSCTVSGNNVTVTTSLNYPGATRIYTIVMKNNGNIRAKWNYLDGFTNNIQQCSYGEYSACDTTPDKDYLTAANDYFQYLPSIRHAAFKDASGNFTVIVDEDIEDVADSNGDIYLEPGESLYFLVWNLWNEELDNDYNYRDGNYFTFTLDFDFTFEQATD